jgi:enamine deaminase RidA (YjgF/YER057c/UK114 family)
MPPRYQSFKSFRTGWRKETARHANSARLLPEIWGLADVLKTTVYVASGDRGDLVAAWEVVRAAFADHDAPSTLLGVAVLGYAGQLVEVEAVAAAGRSDPVQ